MKKRVLFFSFVLFFSALCAGLLHIRGKLNHTLISFKNSSPSAKIGSADPA
jgi:hypothetical protein